MTGKQHGPSHAARDPRTDPRAGDVFRRRKREYRVADVSGHARKVHAPGYVALERSDKLYFYRRMCGTEWLRWIDGSEFVRAGG